MKERVTVIGNGGWGTAMALVLLENGHEVTLWGHDPVYTERIARERENPKFLPGIPLPQQLQVTHEHETAVKEAGIIASAVPTRFLRTVLQGFKGVVPARVPFVSLTKGIEHETFLRPTQIIRAIHPAHPAAVLSGPSHAEEVALRIPASVVVAARSKELAGRLQAIFSTDRFRVYTNGDPLGVELGGALKNVIAIAAGVCDGLGFGDNTKAALVTRGLAEMARLAAALGAKKLTLTGLAGIGDLITTAFSRHGRNRAVGEKLARGVPLERILRETETVAEGVYTTQSVMAMAQEHGIEMPISREVEQMLFHEKDPANALDDLMRRSHKAEEWS